MSIAAAIRRLIATGFTIDQALAAAEILEDEMQPKRSAGAVRQERYRERHKPSQTVTGNAKESPSQTLPKENSSSLRSEDNNHRGRAKPTPKGELLAVIDETQAEAVLDHRKRLRKPLTAHAAKLLAAKFAKCRDPCAAADAMIANGWQGFEPDWLDNRNGNGNAPGTRQNGGKSRPHDTLLRAIAERFAPSDGLDVGQADADDGLHDVGRGPLPDRELDLDLPAADFRRT